MNNWFKRKRSKIVDESWMANIKNRMLNNKVNKGEIIDWL